MEKLGEKFIENEFFEWIFWMNEFLNEFLNEFIILF